MLANETACPEYSIQASDGAIQKEDVDEVKKNKIRTKMLSTQQKRKEN